MEGGSGNTLNGAPPGNFEVNSVNADKRTWARTMRDVGVDWALVVPSRPLESFRRDAKYTE